MPINLTWTCGSELPSPIKVKHLRSSVQKMATNQIKKAGAAVEQGKEKLTDEEQLELSMKQLSLLHIKVCAANSCSCWFFFLERSWIVGGPKLQA